jgi:hypothetical protein
MNNDLDRSLMNRNNGLLLQDIQFLLNDTLARDFQTELSVEIIKLVHKQLQNAEIEGRITAQTRDRLLHRYITDLKHLEHGIKRKTLHERLQQLEKMQEQLVQEYHENLSQLHTEIQRFQVVPDPNETMIHRTNTRPPQPLLTTAESKQVRLPKASHKRAQLNRFKAIQRIGVSTLRKYLLSTIIITALTMIGIQYGMTIFMAAGSLLIGGTLLLRFLKQ